MPLPRRIPTDNYHRSKKQILLADQHKNHHTSQQQHNTRMTTTTTTTSTRINLTMAKTQRLPKSASPQLSKHNVQDDNISDKDNDNDGSERKSKKAKKDNAKSKKDDTESKTVAVTLDLDADNNVATHTAGPMSSRNKRPIEQLQKEQSTNTTEEDNFNMPVLGSTVSKKNNIFHFGKYCLY
jgi:hypothetical protein